jgi:hypothetical protein
MLKDLLEPIVLNRMLNAVLLMFVATVFWSWLTAYGLPMNIWLGGTVLIMTFDLKDYSEDPRPAAVLIGAALVPFWPVLRFWMR